MSQVEQERPFQPFRQSAEGRHVRAGRGLWTSERIVEAMGGQVLLVATTGPAGGRFEIHLPVPAVKAMPKAPVAAA
jgi:signal transduction histidine kinase